MKKIIIGVLVLAVVSTVLTLGYGMFAYNPTFLKMGMSGGSSEVIQSMPMMGSRLAPDAGISIGKDMLVPEIYPYPGDNALSVSDRVYDVRSSLSLVVGDVSGYLKKQREMVLSKGGRVLSFSQGKSEKYAYGYVSVAVPMSEFEEVSRLMETDAVSVYAASQFTSDITGQVEQMQFQVQQLEGAIVELQAQLDEATTAAERRRIQYQITTQEQQLERLQRSRDRVVEETNFAMMDITVADSVRYFDPQTRGSWAEEFQKAFESLRSMGGVLLVILIWVSVYAIIWIPILLAGRWVWRRLQKNKK